MTNRRAFLQGTAALAAVPFIPVLAARPIAVNWIFLPDWTAWDSTWMDYDNLHVMGLSLWWRDGSNMHSRRNIWRTEGYHKRDVNIRHIYRIEGLARKELADWAWRKCWVTV